LGVSFPVYFHFLGLRIHPHLVFEVLAYTGGFQLYLYLRRRAAGRLETESNLWVIAGAILGAAVGSKVLAWAESFNAVSAHWSDPRAWMSGKTIVGGLLGGWVGVEVAKWRCGVRQSTGDLMVFPLIIGMAVGRIGCFLTGLDDHTYGVATALPWGVDFGDGVRRHPTQVYEIAFLATLGLSLWVTRVFRAEGAGRTFRWFMLGYLLWRFAIEFLKPREIRVAGASLSAIQVASLVGTVVCAASLWRPGMAAGRATAPEQPQEAMS
jgi:phosphatidylglycerol:prolipoprotein diacylglycerol transferase